MTVREILVKRAEVRSKMQAIHAAFPDGELPHEKQAEWTAHESELANLDAQQSRQAALDDLDRRIAGTPAAGLETREAPTVRMAGRDVAVPQSFDGRVMTAQDGTRVPLIEARHSFSAFLSAEQRESEIGLGQYIRAIALGPQNDAERRAMAEGSVGTGGAFVPAPLSAQLIDLYRAQSVAFRAGVVAVPMDSATLKFAQITADPVGGWRAEAAAITEGTPTFANVTLSAKSWALLVKVSRELLMDGQNTSGIIESVFARVAAVALDQAILYGIGSSNQPLGVANTSGIQTVSMGTNGAALSAWTKVLDAIAALEAVNAGVMTAMILPPRTAREIYGLADTTGQPLAIPPRLAGIPILATTSMPINETQGSSSVASSILMGDFSQVYVGIRHGLQISVLNERYADTGQIGFVAHIRADALVARPAAIARITGVT